MFEKKDDFKPLELPQADKTEKRPKKPPVAMPAKAVTGEVAKPAKSKVVAGEVAKPAKSKVVGEVVDVGRRLSALARSVKSNRKKAVDAVLAVGEALLEARNLLADHHGGSWGRWVTERAGMGRMTAHRFIQLWEVFGGCPSAIQLGDLDALRKLSTAGDEAIDHAKRLMDDGERVDLATAKKLISTNTTKSDTERSRPEQTIVELDSGFIVFKPRTDDTTPDMMVREFLAHRKEQRAA